MENEQDPGRAPHFAVIKRVGWALIAAGSLDIARMLWCFVHHIAYASSFNICAVVAGALMVRGNLTATEVVRFFATLFTSAFVAAALVQGLVMPFALILAEFRHLSASLMLSAILAISLVGFMAWIARELNSQLVRFARIQAALRVRGVALPALLGICIAVCTGVAIALVQHSVSGQRAVAEARKHYGNGYRYYVERLHVFTANDTSIGSAQLIAWDAHQVRTVQVDWR